MAKNRIFGRRQDVKLKTLHLVIERVNPLQPHNNRRFNYIEQTPRNAWGWPLYHAIKAMGDDPEEYVGKRMYVELISSNGCELENLIVSTQHVDWPMFVEAAKKLENE